LLAIRVQQDTVDGNRRYEVERLVMQLRDEPLVAVDDAVELGRMSDARLAARLPVDEVRATRGDDSCVSLESSCAASPAGMSSRVSNEVITRILMCAFECRI
jgi:hypothetical protein